MSLEHLKWSSGSPLAQRGSGGKKLQLEQRSGGAEERGTLRINNSTDFLKNNGQALPRGDGILVSSLGIPDEKSQDVHE